MKLTFRYIATPSSKWKVRSTVVVARNKAEAIERITFNSNVSYEF